MCPAILYLTLSALYLPVSFFPCVESSQACPHQCVCYDPSDLVDCRDQGFKHIPRGIPHGAWLLELGGNNLSHIGTRAFAGLWSLRVLVLTHCQIKEVKPQVGILKAMNNSLKFKKKMQESTLATNEGNLLVFIVLPPGLFLFVLSGEARPQLEPANVPPSRLFHQSVCSQRAAIATQQLTTPNWIQVVLCSSSAFGQTAVLHVVLCLMGQAGFIVL